jgi:hypothetical protein
MNSQDQHLVTLASLDKFRNAVELVKASLGKLSPYDAEHEYTADECEPYDALCDRFVRAVEVGLKFFRSFERYQFGEDSETLRDLLNRMEKLEMISSVEQWFKMRDIRNRIVHDYIPAQIKQIYDDIMDIFGPELIACAKKTSC